MHNTRSKVSKKNVHNEQPIKNIIPPENIKNTENYGVDEDGAPERINTKRSKIDSTLQQKPSSSDNNEDMNIYTLEEKRLLRN
ncbi:unnamed protein product [Rhizophagus irregularis]|nr:unnamed protein product [Rhizophagus irregularis]